MEDFEERVEAEARSVTTPARGLKPCNVDMSMFANLGDMTEAQWEAALTAAKDMHRQAREQRKLNGSRQTSAHDAKRK